MAATSYPSQGSNLGFPGGLYEAARKQAEAETALPAWSCLDLNIATRVDDLRRAKGWTKTELARRSELHYQHLYKVLAGERTHISVETVMALARAFGVTPNDILGWEEVRHADA